ncbi:MAG: hypothetical protein LBQ75_01995 [Zoogloeaceae bacterium]|jgi:hypothetical protein|nr:hypothetical protein [Zoogloeaceae bacterium]
MKPAFSRFLFLLAFFTSGLAAQAHAEDAIEICFNYSCRTQQPVVFAPEPFNAILQELARTEDAESERAALATVVGNLYALAAEQTPIGNDKGGNYADDGVWGRMDCIDHSTTTTRFLKRIEAEGALRWHRVLEPARRARFFLFQHFSAVIEETGETGRRYAVDSWFVDNGKPAVILPLKDWMKGAGPNV